MIDPIESKIVSEHSRQESMLRLERVAAALEREFPECVDEGRTKFLMRLARAAEASAMRLAYGLLWHMQIDREDANLKLASDARRTLASALGEADRYLGIDAAKMTDARFTGAACPPPITGQDQMTDLLKLAERVEQASGGDLVLDAQIYKSLNKNANSAAQIAGCCFVPKYSASIDAAMTLLEPDWDADVTIVCHEGGPSAYLARGYEDSFTAIRKHKIEARAATPALALTAAALKALAHQGLEGEGSDGQ